MHKLYELKEKLIEELEDYAENGKFSKDDVEAIKYTASAIDHICNIMERSEDDGYSMAMNRRMGMRNGSYARGRRRDNMGRYSRASENIAMELRELMDDAPDERIRMEIQNLINKVEKM